MYFACKEWDCKITDDTYVPGIRSQELELPIKPESHCPDFASRLLTTWDFVKVAEVNAEVFPISHHDDSATT